MERSEEDGKMNFVATSDDIRVKVHCNSFQICCCQKMTFYLQITVNILKSYLSLIAHLVTIIEIINL